MYTSLFIAHSLLVFQNNSATPVISPTSFTSPSVLVPAVMGIVALLVTNIILLRKIRWDAKATLKRELTAHEIGRLRERLREFYDPLILLADINADVFLKYNRKTFPENEHQRKEALAVWNAKINDVLLPNNEKMCDIIKLHLNLIDPSDDPAKYTSFIFHAESYEAFRKQRNELHKKYPYPQDFDSNLRAVRERVDCELKAAEKYIGTYLQRKNQ